MNWNENTATKINMDTQEPCETSLEAEDMSEVSTSATLVRGDLVALDRAVGSLLSKESAVVHENANKDARVFNTQRDLTAGVLGKTYGLAMLPQHVAKAHERGEIHFHEIGRAHV